MPDQLPIHIKDAIKCGPVPEIRDTTDLPAAELTRGEKVIRFAETFLKVPEGMHVGKPLELDLFQKVFILALFDGGDVTEAYLSIARRNGKALCLETPIPTPDGFVRMGDLKEGDQVFDEEGCPCNVTFATPVQYNRKCYRVEFNDGTSLIADAEHQWGVYDRADDARKYGGAAHRPMVVKTTAELLEAMSDVPGNNVMRWGMPSSGAVRFPEADLPIHPYTLGVWLGDGCSYFAHMYSGERDVDWMVNRLKSVGEDVIRRPPDKNNVTKILFSNGVKNRTKDCVSKSLRNLGLLKDKASQGHLKHIPDIYLCASVEQRMELLRGLVDTDGSVSKSQGQIEIVTVVPKLASDIACLVRGLGYRCTVKSKRASFDGKDCGVAYRVTFTARLTGLIPFKQDNIPDTPLRHSGTSISSIVPVESRPVRCIQVDSPNSLFLAGRSFTVTHNTFVIAVVLLAFIIGPVAERNTTLCSAAMSRDQAAAVFELMVKMLDMAPKLQGRYKVTPSSKQIVGLKLNVQYRAISSDAKTGHGKAYKIILLDEAGQIDAESNAFVEMLASSQSNYEDPLFIVISTQAPSDASYFSILLDNAERSQDQYIISHVYSADKNCDLLDVDQQRKANPGLGKFRSEKEMNKQALKAKALPSAANGILNLNYNQRVSLAEMFMSPEVWKKCLRPIDKISRMVEPIDIGLDLSQRTDLTAATGSWRTSDGEINIETHAFAPSIGVEQRALRDRAPYEKWTKAGKLMLTPGESVDYEWVCNYLALKFAGCNIRSVQFDRYRIDHFSEAAKKTDFYAMVGEWVPVGQGYISMSPRVEAFEIEAMRGKLLTGNHPLLNNAMAHAVAVQDPSGNRKLFKNKSTQRIDPAIAALMSVFPNSDGQVGAKEFDPAALIG